MITDFWELGRKAADARNIDDEPAALQISDQFRKARAAEKEGDREAASVAYHRSFGLHRKLKRT